MLRYLETFYRHRLLLISPLILALVASIGFVLVQPRTYEATANIRFDQPVSDAASATYLSPAEQGAAQFRELLKTRSFAGKVGRRGPLAAELIATNARASGPISMFLNIFRATGGRSLDDPNILDDLLVDTLSKKTVVITSGPQIVSISFDYQNSQVVAGTVTAMTDQFETELISNRRNRAQAAVDFYKQQVQAQAIVLADADAKVFQYLQAHPAQRSAAAIEDVQLTSLRSNDDLARERYRDLLLKLDQAQVDIAAVNQQGSSGFRVVDAPTVPYRSKSFLKSALLAGVGGLFAGLILFLIGLMALTATDTSARRPEEVETQLGQRVVGSIPRLR